MQESPMTGTGVQILTISQDQAGQRVDNFLHALTSGVPKSHIYRIIRTGQVRVNKGRIKPTYRLQADDQLRVPPLQQRDRETVTVPSDIVQLLETAIVFENELLLVVNKPPGLAVHAGSGLHYGVIDAFRQSRREAGTRLELAHRLDRGTSGCLIMGKTQRSARDLQDLFRQSRVQKNYLGLTVGHWPVRSFEINKALATDSASTQERRVVVSSQGKNAVSRFTLVEAFGSAAQPTASLMDIQIDTGRTHQIRVHAASEGHAIVGDDKYGGSDDVQRFRKLGLKRLYLHCNEMVLDIGSGLTLRADPGRGWEYGLNQLRVGST